MADDYATRQVAQQFPRALDSVRDTQAVKAEAAQLPAGGPVPRDSVQGRRLGHVTMKGRVEGGHLRHAGKLLARDVDPRKRGRIVQRRQLGQWFCDISV